MGSLLLVAIGVAMDCMAVAAATAVAVRSFRWTDALRLASVFGGMQAAMAGIGWAGGAGLERAIHEWDHWVAFLLLLAIGGRMIRESFRTEEEKSAAGFGFGPLAILGVATSIDSLAVGLTLPILGVPWEIALGLIGATSFVLSLVAVYLAERLRRFVGNRLGIVGGLVLIAIGAKILVEHL